MCRHRCISIVTKKSSCLCSQRDTSSNENVGIGISSLQAKLHVNRETMADKIYTMGSNRFKTFDPYLADIVFGSDRGIRHNSCSMFWSSPSAARICNNDETFEFSAWYTSTLNVALPANLTKPSYIQGSISIGTTSPDQKLTVKGKIHAEEVIVALNVPLADYIFAKDYELMPLHQMERYVEQNSRQPEMSSVAEVKEKGMSEMQNKMLQKIEELTLYVIQLDKRIKTLEEENKRLKK